MPKEEIEMMRDAFVFLRDHNNPPAKGTEEAVRFWIRSHLQSTGFGLS